MIAFPSPRFTSPIALAALLFSASLASAQSVDAPAEPSADVAPSAEPAPSAPEQEAAPQEAPPAGAEAGSVSAEASNAERAEFKLEKKADKDKPEKSKDKPEKEKSKKGSRFDPKGRVIARAELARRKADVFSIDSGVRRKDVDSLDLALPSVRAGFRYTSPIEGLSATLSLELKGRVQLKDGYADYRGEVFRARAGQFKLPTSPIDADGRLSLPTADRGFINEILTDRLEIGGRRPGVMVSANTVQENPDDVAVRFILGAFQGSYLEDPSTRDTDLLEEQSLGAQTALARAELRFGAFEFGGYATYRVGTEVVPLLGEAPSHFWAGALDAKLDAPLAGGGLRLWVDVTLGESWYSESKQKGDPTFIAGRAIVAYRFGGLDKGEFYVEPYGMVGALDPDLRVSSDLASEAALGVNVGFWKRGRLTLQGDAQRTRRNFPDSYALEFYRNRRSLLTQVAVEF